MTWEYKKGHHMLMILCNTIRLFDVKNGLIYNGIKSRGLYILRDMPKTESTGGGKCFNFAIVPFAKMW